ncbi:hypothetical protein CTI14_52480, partial [Methylobacterium radiotolerans]
SLGEGDRGIGGTGVIGTIRRFGSIVVNDLRIAYPPEVEVRIDGTAATCACSLAPRPCCPARSGRRNRRATRASAAPA